MVSGEDFPNKTNPIHLEWIFSHGFFPKSWKTHYKSWKIHYKSWKIHNKSWKIHYKSWKIHGKTNPFRVVFFPWIFPMGFSHGRNGHPEGLGLCALRLALPWCPVLKVVKYTMKSLENGRNGRWGLYDYTSYISTFFSCFTSYNFV